MNISAITGTYARQAYAGQMDTKRPVKGGIVDSSMSKGKITQPKDRVELSGPSLSKLDAIKNKVSKGFYHNTEVIDDITDKLTKYFDEATE